MKSKSTSWLYATISLLFYMEMYGLNHYPVGAFLFISPLIALVNDYTIRESESHPRLMPFLIIITGIMVFGYLFRDLDPISSVVSGFQVLLPIAIYAGLRITMRHSVAFLGLIMAYAAQDFLIMQLPLDDRLVFADVFYSRWEWTKWYSYTGVLGGTIWMTFINIFFYQSLFRDEAIFKKVIRWRSIILTLISIILPIWISTQSVQNGHHDKSVNIERDTGLEERWSAVLIEEEERNGDISMYSEYGEYLGRTAAWVTILIILYMFVKLKLKPKKPVHGPRINPK